MKRVIILIPIIIFFILPYLYCQEIEPQKIYENVSPAVLQIRSYDSDSIVTGWGSAVAVGSEGIVYTNMHIFKDAKWMELIIENKTVREIKIIGFDPDKDVLILKIPSGLVEGIKSANSNSVLIGEKVYALGNPENYMKTFSSGLLSGRRNEESEQLQYTASISHGSSGGALLNSKGELIGITSAMNTVGQNLNFAVPVKYFLNCEVINPDDTAEVNLISDIAELYNSTSKLGNTDAAVRLGKFSLLTLRNRNALYTTANLLNQYSLYEIAKEICSRALEFYPLDKQFYVLRGRVYLNLDKNDSALGDFNRSIQLDSTYLNALFARSDFYRYTLSDNKSAINDLLRILKKQDGYEYLDVYIAQMYYELKDSASAVKYLKASSYGANMKADDYYLRGRVYNDLGLYDEAAYNFEAAINLNGGSINYYSSLAIAYSHLGVYDKASYNYLMVLCFNPSDVTALNNLAYSYYNMRDYEEAEKYFKKALSFDKKHFDSFIGLSLTYAKLNRKKECVQNMQKAISLKRVLMKGLQGLDSLKKDGFFWSGLETWEIKNVLIQMRIEEGDDFTNLWGDKAEGSLRTVNRSTRAKILK